MLKFAFFIHGYRFMPNNAPVFSTVAWECHSFFSHSLSLLLQYYWAVRAQMYAIIGLWDGVLKEGTEFSKPNGRKSGSCVMF
jgi:hypothetical protein